MPVGALGPSESRDKGNWVTEEVRTLIKQLNTCTIMQVETKQIYLVVAYEHAIKRMVYV